MTLITRKIEQLTKRLPCKCGHVHSGACKDGNCTCQVARVSSSTVAEALGISTSYLSLIRTGRRLLGDRARRRLEAKVK